MIEPITVLYMKIFRPILIAFTLALAVSGCMVGPSLVKSTLLWSITGIY